MIDIETQLRSYQHADNIRGETRLMCRRAADEIKRLRDDRWKHGAECMRQAILQQLPSEYACNPKWIADMICAIAVPSADEQDVNK